MRKTWRWLALMVIMATILACQSTGSFGVNRQVPTATLIPLVEPTPSAAPGSAAPAPAPNISSGQVTDLSSIYERVSPGVVTIIVTGDVVNGVQSGGLGSGIVYDLAGDIITNDHVIDGAKSIEVDFMSGFKVTGKVIGTDLDSDLAVVKVQAPQSELKPLVLGDSSKLKVGVPVVAIGNPLGLTGTMTSGIVSALGRTMDSLHTTSDGTFYTAGDIIQTDAAINPGNSGGPLLNLDGEVVGLVRAIRTTNTTATGEPSNSGLGFAVSSNIMKRVIPQLIKTGKVDYPYLGLTSLSDISLSQQKSLGLDRSTGAYITGIVPGGPADKAGLHAGNKPTDDPDVQAGGDLIIAVDNHPVLVFGDLLSYMIDNKGPGDSIVVKFIRDNQEKEATVVLGKRP